MQHAGKPPSMAKEPHFPRPDNCLPLYVVLIMTHLRQGCNHFSASKNTFHGKIPAFRVSVLLTFTPIHPFTSYICRRLLFCNVATAGKLCTTNTFPFPRDSDKIGAACTAWHVFNLFIQAEACFSVCRAVTAWAGAAGVSAAYAVALAHV